MNVETVPCLTGGIKITSQSLKKIRIFHPPPFPLCNFKYTMAFPNLPWHSALYMRNFYNCTLSLACNSTISKSYSRSRTGYPVHLLNSVPFMPTPYFPHPSSAATMG